MVFRTPNCQLRSVATLGDSRSIVWSYRPELVGNEIARRNRMLKGRANLGPPFDLGVVTFDWVGGVQVWPMLRRNVISASTPVSASSRKPANVVAIKAEQGAVRSPRISGPYFGFACPSRNRAARRLPGAPIDEGCLIGRRNPASLDSTRLCIGAAKSDGVASAPDPCDPQRANLKLRVGLCHNVGDKFTRKRGTRELLAQFRD